MIAGIFHKGSGLGNQLFRYVMARSLALDKGVEWGMQNAHLFKGASFMHLDMGSPVSGITHTFIEKKVTIPNGTDVRDYDWAGVQSIKDDTIIDGEFQGEQYFKYRKNEIREWLAVPLLDLPENMCIISFRGGEYVNNADLFLTKKYWSDAISHMRSINPEMQFRVVTDDPNTARLFFPEFPVSHDMKDDYICVQSASYMILSNSSFSLFPAWLNERAKCIIAPKYWARHNVSDGYWACGYNMIQGWLYLDREGMLHDYAACLAEWVAYKQNHAHAFIIAPAGKQQNILHVFCDSCRRMIGHLTPKPMKQSIRNLIDSIKDNSS